MSEMLFSITLAAKIKIIYGKKYLCYIDTTQEKITKYKNEIINNIYTKDLKQDDIVVISNFYINKYKQVIIKNQCKLLKLDNNMKSGITGEQLDLYSYDYLKKFPENPFLIKNINKAASQIDKPNIAICYINGIDSKFIQISGFLLTTNLLKNNFNLMDYEIDNIPDKPGIYIYYNIMENDYSFNGDFLELTPENKDNFKNIFNFKLIQPYLELFPQQKGLKI